MDKKAAFLFRLAVCMVFMWSSYKSRTLGSRSHFSGGKKKCTRSVPKGVMDRELRVQCRHWIISNCKETNILRYGFPNHDPRAVVGQPVSLMRPAVTFENYVCSIKTTQ